MCLVKNLLFKSQSENFKKIENWDFSKVWFTSKMKIPSDAYEK